MHDVVIALPYENWIVRMIRLCWPSAKPVIGSRLHRLQESSITINSGNIYEAFHQ